MSVALILYGSRARSAASITADTDLILADQKSGLGYPTQAGGVSLHHYPQPWLLSEARAGNLFVYHVGVEGVALHDDDGFLLQLRNQCTIKPDYSDEIKAATAAAIATLRSDWKFEPKVRRRFFWALRTILIATTAQSGVPVFDYHQLESDLGIEGLGGIIQARDSLDRSHVETIGWEALHRYGVGWEDGISQEVLIDWLYTQGGISTNTARLLGERRAIELGVSLYE